MSTLDHQKAICLGPPLAGRIISFRESRESAGDRGVDRHTNDEQVHGSAQDRKDDPQSALLFRHVENKATLIPAPTRTSSFRYNISIADFQRQCSQPQTGIPVLADCDKRGRRFSHMTIEQLAQSGLEIFCDPRQAGREQVRFETTNPGYYLRTRAERGDMPTDFILSSDELHEKGLEGLIAKERRCWFRKATRLLQPAGGTGPTDPRQVRLLRDAWARHQRLLEGPPITSKEQVEFPALLGIKHFDPTSLAYALKVHHDISNVPGTEILPATEDLHDHLGNKFPSAAEVQNMKAVMCWDAPALFFAEDQPCDEKELVRVLARLGHASVGLEGSLGLPCGVVADTTHLRRDDFVTRNGTRPAPVLHARLEIVQARNALVPRYDNDLRPTLFSNWRSTKTPLKSARLWSDVRDFTRAGK